MAKDMATLNGIEIETETISDSFPNAVIEHEFPARDGANLEPMGLKARSVSLRCYFLNERYPDHQKILALQKHRRDLLELYHPKYGLLTGYVRNFNIRHSDALEACEIDIDFVEQTIDLEISIVEDVKNQVAEQLAAGQAQQMAELAADTQDTLGNESKGILDQVLDPDEGILAQFTTLSNKARTYISKIDSIVTQMEATLNTISNPANSLIASINYGVNLPGRIIKDVTRVAERYAILYQNLKSSPAQFVQSFKDGMTALENTLGLNDTETGTPQKTTTQVAAQNMIKKHMQIAGAQCCAWQLGEMFSDDEANRQQVRTAEGTKSFDAEGNYLKTAELPAILTVNEIEKSLAATREYIQAAVDQAREVQALKDLARSLLKHVNIIKLEREKIIQVEIPNLTPLHLICLQYGLPYNYAKRILSINPQIQNPNFVSGVISIYVR